MTLGGHLSCNLSCRIDLSSPSRVTTTLAGSGKHDHRDGVGTDASFDYPGGPGPRTRRSDLRGRLPGTAAHNATIIYHHHARRPAVSRCAQCNYLIVYYIYHHTRTPTVSRCAQCNYIYILSYAQANRIRKVAERKSPPGGGSGGGSSALRWLKGTFHQHATQPQRRCHFAAQGIDSCGVPGSGCEHEQDDGGTDADTLLDAIQQANLGYDFVGLIGNGELGVSILESVNFD
eukprot:COSAG01_NODE_4292_length_5167_cov_2.551500_4_plen_232_part_00